MPALRSLGAMVRRGVATLAVLLGAGLSRLDAATLFQETFETQEGWSGSGQLSVTHDGSGGDPGGAVVGTFSGGIPSLRTGAFAVGPGDSGNNFFGSWADFDDPYIRFDMFSVESVPLSLSFEFSGAGQTLIRDLVASDMSVGQWHTYSFSLGNAGWSGGLYQDAIANVTNMRIHVSQFTGVATHYRIDNFELYDGPVNPTGAVPEPGTFVLLSLSLAAIMGVRRSKRCGRLASVTVARPAGSFSEYGTGRRVGGIPPHRRSVDQRK